MVIKVYARTTTLGQVMTEEKEINEIFRAREINIRVESDVAVNLRAPRGERKAFVLVTREPTDAELL